MDTKIQNMLNSHDPAMRIEAVKALAKEATPDAMEELAYVYRTDSDESVREMARKGGIYIRKKLQEEGGSRKKAEPVVVEVSEKKQESAQKRVARAMDWHVQGMDDKAQDELRKAFADNPNLRDDKYATGLASTVTGLPDLQAFDYLTGQMEPEDIPGVKVKRKPKRGDDEDVSTGKVLVDLAIYYIVNVVIVIIGGLLALQFVTGVFDIIQAELGSEIFQNPEFGETYTYTNEAGETVTISGGELLQVQQIFSIFGSLGVIATIIYGLISGVFYVIGLLIGYAVLHVVAVYMLGGVGTYKGLIHRLTNFLTIWTVLTVLFSFAMTYLIFNPFFNALTNPSPDVASETLLNQAFQSSTASISFLSLVGFVVSILFIFWISQRIGQNYQFGTGRGCATIIVSYILGLFLMCGCYFLVFSSIISSMSNFGTGF